MRRQLLVLLGVVCLTSGCQMFQWAKPHQLWKLNRQSSIARDDAYFNVPPQSLPRKVILPGEKTGQE